MAVRLDAASVAEKCVLPQTGRGCSWLWRGS